MCVCMHFSCDLLFFLQGMKLWRMSVIHLQGVENEKNRSRCHCHITCHVDFPSPGLKERWSNRRDMLWFVQFTLSHGQSRTTALSEIPLSNQMWGRASNSADLLTGCIHWLHSTEVWNIKEKIMTQPVCADKICTHYFHKHLICCNPVLGFWVLLHTLTHTHTHTHVGMHAYTQTLTHTPSFHAAENI